MKKLMSFSLFSVIVMLGISCSDPTNSDSGYGLPTEFPLEEGNAWIYEISDYENGVQIYTFIETLFVFAKFEEYYLYSWQPESYADIVRNYDNKFILCGIVFYSDSEPDTTFYDPPFILAFYGVTGNIDATHYENYSNPFVDSAYVSVLNNEEYLNNKYDTYLFEEYYNSNYGFISRKYSWINKLGYVYSEYYNENINLLYTETMIEKLENFYPSDNVNIKNSLTNKSKIHFQNGFSHNLRYNDKVDNSRTNP